MSHFRYELRYYSHVSLIIHGTDRYSCLQHIRLRDPFVQPSVQTTCLSRITGSVFTLLTHQYDFLRGLTFAVATCSVEALLKNCSSPRAILVTLDSFTIRLRPAEQELVYCTPTILSLVRTVDLTQTPSKKRQYLYSREPQYRATL